MQKERKKIAIIDNSIAVTGAFKCALQEAELLLEKHRFLFIIPKGSSNSTIINEKGFDFYELPMLELSKTLKSFLLYIPFLFKNAIALKKILHQEQVFVLQVNDVYNLLGIAVKVLGFSGRLITYVRFLPDRFPKILRNTWLYLANKYSHRVVAVSDAVLKQVPKNERTVRIYDPIFFTEKSRAGNKHNDDVSKAEVVLLYLANYTRGKGQNYAIEAFSKAYKINQHLRLVFAGSDMGLEKNATYRKELEYLVVSKSLNNVVYFQDFSNNIEELIKKVDIVLNFSESESFSMTCLEASYIGTPVIATKCGGPEEIIIDNKTGLLVEIGNVEQMTDAISKLAGSELLRRSFSKSAKSYVTEKFAPAKFIEAFNREILL